MSIAIHGRIVVFDYGEVISAAPSAADREEIARLAGADPAELWAAYWHHRDAYDDGSLPARNYWEAIASDLGAVWDAATIHRLWLADFRSWLQVDDRILEILLDLQRGGTRMALLSNAAPDFSSYYRHGMLGDLFERVFTSSEFGVLKPSPAIFDIVILGLERPPRELIFIDDREANVRAAQASGMTAHRYTGPAELRRYLETMASAKVTRTGGEERSRPAR